MKSKNKIHSPITDQYTAMIHFKRKGSSLIEWVIATFLNELVFEVRWRKAGEENNPSLVLGKGYEDVNSMWI